MAQRKSTVDEQIEEHMGNAVELSKRATQGDVHHPDAALSPVVEGEVTQFGPAMTSLAEWLADKASGNDSTTALAMENAVARILSGESAEDVLTSDVPVSGKMYVDKPFTLYGFAITESDFEEGSPYYANLDVTLGTDPRRRILNVGGIKVLAKLMKLDEFGEWPVVVKLTSSETKRGYQVLDLVMHK
jgi:hypothetical protein